MPFSVLAAAPLLASLVLSYRSSPDKVYIAADSRLTSTEARSTLPDDSACKIRVLTDGVVFVGTGNTLFSVNGRTTDIYNLAASAAATLPRRPLQSADLRRIALAWQTRVRSRLQARLKASAQGLAAESVTGTTGSFYATTADGSIAAITLRIAPGHSRRLASIEEPQAPAAYLVATGTEAAKQDALAIADSPQNATLPWPNRLEAIEAQTIREEAQRYGSHAEIGGPIDLIEITSKGPTWLARKPSCSNP